MHLTLKLKGYIQFQRKIQKHVLRSGQAHGMINSIIFYLINHLVQLEKNFIPSSLCVMTCSLKLSKNFTRSDTFFNIWHKLQNFEWLQPMTFLWVPRWVKMSLQFTGPGSNGMMKSLRHSRKLNIPLNGLTLNHTMVNYSFFLVNEFANFMENIMKD